MNNVEEEIKRTKTVDMLLDIETALRKKCKRYKKYVKGLNRGIKWRNEVIIELAFRLGMSGEEAKSITERGFGEE